MPRLRDGQINRHEKANGVRYYRACVGKEMKPNGRPGPKTFALGTEYGTAKRMLDHLRYVWEWKIQDGIQDGPFPPGYFDLPPAQRYWTQGMIDKAVYVFDLSDRFGRAFLRLADRKRQESEKLYEVAEQYLCAAATQPAPETTQPTESGAIDDCAIETHMNSYALRRDQPVPELYRGKPAER